VPPSPVESGTKKWEERERRDRTWEFGTEFLRVNGTRGIVVFPHYYERFISFS